MYEQSKSVIIVKSRCLRSHVTQLGSPPDQQLFMAGRCRRTQTTGVLASSCSENLLGWSPKVGL
jgi:hypothetical protein